MPLKIAIQDVRKSVFSKTETLARTTFRPSTRRIISSGSAGGLKAGSIADVRDQRGRHRETRRAFQVK